jgi:beta-lactamase class A
MKKLEKLFDSKKFLKAAVLLFGAVIIILSVFGHFKKSKYYVTQDDNIIHDKSNPYIFTNPVLDCEAFEPSEAIIPQQELRDKVNSIKEKNNLSSLSVYFRDLNNGPWVGVNEKDTFLPGSLLKTPYFISYLRNLQDDPTVKDKKVIVTADDAKAAIGQNIKPPVMLETGKEYTLGQVAENTIKYSDNVAFSVLIKNVTSEYVNDIYRAIGNVYDKEGTELSIRVRDAASFFRILYNASYLDRDMSEYALKIFSETTYKNALVAGVPTSIKVAHKFGERSDTATTGTGTPVIQVHDCGIIYYPGKPYILCVMTRGTNIGEQEKSIAELSKYFYNKIDKETKHS